MRFFSAIIALAFLAAALPAEAAALPVPQAVEIPSGAAVLHAQLFKPEGNGPFPAVMLFQEAYGVNDHIMDVAERIAREGYVVIAPELFHRTAPAGFVAAYGGCLFFPIGEGGVAEEEEGAGRTGEGVHSKVVIGRFCVREGVDKGAFGALMELAPLAGFEVLAMDDEDLGRAVFGRGLCFENGGEGSGERQQQGAAGEKVTDESVHSSPRNG